MEKQKLHPIEAKSVGYSVKEFQDLQFLLLQLRGSMKRINASEKEAFLENARAFILHMPENDPNRIRFINMIDAYENQPL